MKRYSREAILQDKRLANYQQDFLRVILTKESYTLAEARKTAAAFFERRSDLHGRWRLDHTK